jgi:predicted phage tail protein
MGKETGAPEGVPKSGRTWKTKQTQRFSAQQRTGFLKNQCKSFDEREAIRKQKQQVLGLEREMVEDKKKKIREKKERRVEQEKRRKENEYKSSAFQVVSVL